VVMGRIYLDRNENQYGPAPACYKVLREANLEQLSLYSRAYASGKKSDLSERLSHDTGLPEKQILLSYGSEDMLKQVVHCYLHRDETILLPHQSWWYYKSVAKEVFGRETHYSMHEHNGRFEYDVQEMIDQYDRHHPQVILIASPNNPTGNSFSLDKLHSLVEHCTSSVIVLDEAYYGFSRSANEHLATLLDAHSRMVILRTFSKYFALAGLRIGYSCVGKDLAQLVEFSARYLGYNLLSEKIALAALDDKEYYPRIAKLMEEDKEMYFNEFSRLQGFTPFPSEANFILVRYPKALKQGLKSGVERRDVIVKFLDDPGLEDCIRITVGTKEQNAKVMDAFKQVACSELGVRTLEAAGVRASA
jgi:histidinol-phosphate aminotransferase